MRSFRLLFAVMLAFTAGTQSFAQSWQLVWADEFNGSIGPDWVFETGAGGWGNNEYQYYRRENASIENNNLVITAKRESFAGANYTSARMKTQGRRSFKYGRIEARIRLTPVQGLWPAFWMLGNNISTVGWPACGEIDVMEQVNTANEVHGTIHWSNQNNTYASYGGKTATTVSSYHIYAVEWDSNAIRWYMDGTKYHEVSIAGGVNGTSEFHNEFFLLLNVAVGGNWPGFTINDAALPAKMYVDYVRVYRAATAGYDLTVQAENYNFMSGVQTEATSDAGGGLNVGWLDANDWMAYTNVNIPTAGTYTFRYRVASPSGGGRLQLELNSGATILGSVTIPATGGWQNWTTITQTVNLPTGNHTIGIKVLSGGWNFNWFRITSGTSTTTMAADAISEETSNSISEELSIYPNPAENELIINTTEAFAGGSVQITDITGKTIYQGLLTSDKIDISHLNQGMYLLRITSKDQTRVKRFIKK